MKYDMLTILGPTATGKTQLAASVAHQLNGEILSADSRQIYRGMDIGTGKDLADYVVEGRLVPYHLIDLVEAGTQYNVFEFQRAFIHAYQDVRKRGRFPVFCGGSGLYLEAVLKGYRLTQVPSDKARREELSQLSLDELATLLKGYKTVHNSSDTETKNRAIRAIEIEEYLMLHPELDFEFPVIHSLIIGVQYDRETRRERITRRLKQRLEEGLVEEVEGLLAKGLSPEDLTYYGLEYKFLTLYLTGELTKSEMFERLNIAIHQFAKRQMTWFRKMEREGFEIHWLDGFMPMEEKVELIMKYLK
ncbi:MAG: tRNA (adenosine(37)-N6)-dimethylallyltransferase MiaA [Prolixibacteraceae bacterium]|nr:tRNA (adenosine(37)-N6)-dimethylallyltransferase MiaA [Prolixibacteraceae bacterium]